MLEVTTKFHFGCNPYTMVNISEELEKLSHDELQFVIDGFFRWVDKTMVRRRINVRSWKAWVRANPTYCKTYPRISVEEQIEKMREQISRARIR